MWQLDRRNSIAAERIGVEKIFQHSKYNSVTHDNDISVLKLKKKLVFSESVQPIALPKAYQAVTVGTKASVSGWGASNELIVDNVSQIRQ